MRRLAKFVERYRVEEGDTFRLDDISPDDSGDLKSEFKAESKALLNTGVTRVSELQDKLYAQDKWALLLVFQAMDAAGKDSVIKHVLSGVNPQGFQVTSFKAPSANELDHDFMWRSFQALPERGRIGIFNRSYYEEVLVVRANSEILASQKLPERLMTENIWDERLEDIRAIERYLSRNGVLIRKFFLHVSKEEQRKRFLERLNKAEKNWKFNINDLSPRRDWDKYMKVYEAAIRATASRDAPWFVVPADKKWFTRLVVSAAIIDALESLDLRYPVVDAAQRRQLVRGRRLLQSE